MVGPRGIEPRTRGLKGRVCARNASVPTREDAPRDATRPQVAAGFRPHEPAPRGTRSDPVKRRSRRGFEGDARTVDEAPAPLDGAGAPVLLLAESGAALLLGLLLPPHPDYLADRPRRTRRACPTANDSTQIIGLLPSRSSGTTSPAPFYGWRKMLPESPRPNPADARCRSHEGDSWIVFLPDANPVDSVAVAAATRWLCPRDSRGGDVGRQAHQQERCGACRDTDPSLQHLSPLSCNFSGG
jgi:hypothetical protein